MNAGTDTGSGYYSHNDVRAAPGRLPEADRPVY